jgi:tRNA(fMet)-specific endonuclease VapC
MSPLYLLDTNILVHLVRGDATWVRIREEYDVLMTSIRPIISAVTEAELRSLSYQWGWGEARLEQMRYYLGYFGRAPLETPAMLEAYALIDAYSERKGHTMGKNDVWVAATAHVTNATLLTTDQDFLHLDGLFLTVERVSLEA